VSQRPVPIREGGADLVRRILPDKVQALGRDFAPIRPFAAKVALAPGQDRAGLGVDEELGNGASAEPLRVFVHYREDVGGLADATTGTARAQALKAQLKRYPFSVGEPEDIARIALFLASDEACMITGVTVPAGEGGLSSY